jgi:metal-responsive CopG/Arc/MetJ family transcriptional regulator
METDSHEKPRKVTVLLDQFEFEAFENYCNDKGFKKSTLVARLIREYLKENSESEYMQLKLGILEDK